MKTVWGAFPTGLRSLLAPLVHPIAAGARGSGVVLEVPPLPARPIFVVRIDPQGVATVLGHGDSPAAGPGDRFVWPVRELETRAEEAEVVDAVVELDAAPAREEGERYARLGWRVVSRSEGGCRESSPPPPALDATIIVTSFNNAELLRHCLAGLRRNTPWPGVEIVVVDNGSDDGAPEILRSAARDYGLHVILNDRNLGYARAVNQALERARGRFVCLLNDDTVVGPGWLPRLIARLESRPELGLIGPVTNQIGNEAKIDAGYADFRQMEAFAVRRCFEHAGVLVGTSQLALFCAAARRETLEELGGLDERYEVGMFEDDDLCLALRQRGYSLAIAPDVFVHHVGQAAFSKLGDERYLAVWESNKRRFEQKWGVRWQPPQSLAED